MEISEATRVKAQALGAARGLPPDAVETALQQARLGMDEGTDALLGVQCAGYLAPHGGKDYNAELQGAIDRAHTRLVARQRRGR